MSGFIVRLSAALVVCVACSATASADSDRLPVLIPYPSLEPAMPPIPDLNVNVQSEVLPAAPAAATGTAIPLPPGVYVGLVGLASAAIARRRYLKRR